MDQILVDVVGGIATFFILAGELLASPAGIPVWIILFLIFTSSRRSGSD